MKSWQIVWETIKFPLRMIVLAIIPVLLNYVGVLDPLWRDIAIAVLIVIDKMLHEIGKASVNETLIKGITRF